jgi:hypothetical protein
MLTSQSTGLRDTEVTFSGMASPRMRPSGRAERGQLGFELVAASGQKRQVGGVRAVGFG